MFYGNRVERLRAVCVLAAAAWLAGCGKGDEPAATTKIDEKARSLAATLATLKASHPGAKVRVKGDRIRRLYGVSATGATPLAATESFRLKSAAAFGIEASDLVVTGSALRSTSSNGLGLMYDRATGKHKFRLFTYEQHRDGIPVFRSGLRTLVREGGNNPVVWANADLRPLGNFKAPTSARLGPIDLERSLEALKNSGVLANQGLTAPAALVSTGAPSPTIFAGTGSSTAPARMAIRYTARDESGPGKWTFVADTETGDILFVESNLHFDISGSVQARRQPGQHPCPACGRELERRKRRHRRIGRLHHRAVGKRRGHRHLEHDGRVLRRDERRGKPHLVVASGHAARAGKLPAPGHAEPCGARARAAQRLHASQSAP
jgi:hypothetical protein